MDFLLGITVPVSANTLRYHVHPVFADFSGEVHVSSTFPGVENANVEMEPRRTSTFFYCPDVAVDTSKQIVAAPVGKELVAMLAQVMPYPARCSLTKMPQSLVMLSASYFGCMVRSFS
ncbi:hypothetical protein [Uliginosibacterium flavum]|uniref:Uncharacterized protein n=1 Tax=Uliginosibacterium flavum TaxID=1396831 RepID=A0ABV2TI66_9RHOO